MPMFGTFYIVFLVTLNLSVIGYALAWDYGQRGRLIQPALFRLAVASMAILLLMLLKGHTDQLHRLAILLTGMCLINWKLNAKIFGAEKQTYCTCLTMALLTFSD